MKEKYDPQYLVVLGDTVTDGIENDTTIDFLNNLRASKAFNDVFLIKGQREDYITKIDTFASGDYIMSQSVRQAHASLSDVHKHEIQHWYESVLFGGSDNILCVHGSPERFDQPLLTDKDVSRAMGNSKYGEYDVAFVGKSHKPSIYYVDLNNQLTYQAIQDRAEFDLDTTLKAIVNVGSVGQPHDRDNRACYVVYDTETFIVHWERVKYDIPRTIGKMQAAGVHPSLWQRLIDGA